MSSLKACLKFLGFALNCLWVIPSQSLFLALHKGNASLILPQFWHRAICAIFGLRVRIEGIPCTNRQVLFLPNHLSYIDIPVIGSVARGFFVAKGDVKGWPVFGFLSGLQQTIFISRSREDALREKNALQDAILKGKSLIIFPEGTSSDGTRILPFKSSLFGLPIEMARTQKDSGRPSLCVQPVTIRLENAPTQEKRDSYAWYGDMELAPHLWAFAKGKGSQITLIFHPPLDPTDFADRKSLAAACHEAVARGLEDDMLGDGIREKDSLAA